MWQAGIAIDGMAHSYHVDVKKPSVFAKKVYDAVDPFFHLGRPRLRLANMEMNSLLKRLKVSGNKRFLVDETDSPFFWLGDTAWELIHRLTKEECAFYLTTRASQKFTVIQTVLLAELDGLRTPNAEGELPLENEDPMLPREAYFKHVDWVLNQAASLGLYMGLLPTWGDKVNQRYDWAKGPEVAIIKDNEQAKR